MTATILTAQQAADYLKITYEHLGVLRRKAAGPPFFNLGWSVRYRKADLDEWIEKRLVRAA